MGTKGLSLDIVRKQSVCVSRSLSIWLRMTLILTRGPIIIFATKNIQLGFVMSIPPHDSLLMQGLSVGRDLAAWSHLADFPTVFF